MNDYLELSGLKPIRLCHWQVLASEFESQKAIQPFLKYPVLRKVVQTLTNDPRNDFDVWASNPRVISMLKVHQHTILSSQCHEST